MTEETTSNLRNSHNSHAYQHNSLFKEFKKIVRDPVGFFRTMPTEGGFTRPFIFNLAITIICVSPLVLLAIVGFYLDVGYLAVQGVDLIMGLVLATSIVSFIIAAIMFVAWNKMGSEKGYQTAYRCIAYASAYSPIIFSISLVPYIGVIAGNAWAVYILYVISIEVHQIEAQLAKKGCLIVAAISLILAVMASQLGSKLDRADDVSDARYQKILSDMQEQYAKPVDVNKGVWKKRVEKYQQRQKEPKQE